MEESEIPKWLIPVEKVEEAYEDRYGRGLRERKSISYIEEKKN